MPPTFRTFIVALILLPLAALVGCGPQFCIGEGALVRTPHGERPIEQLRIGDEVLTEGDRVGVINRLRQGEARRWLVLETADGRRLRATAEHPVRTPEGWLPAGELRAESQITTPDGPSSIASVTPESGRLRVFDISVEPGETFFADGVLVHNKSVARPPTREELLGVWIGVEHGVRVYQITLNADGAAAYAVANPGGEVEAVYTGQWRREHDFQRDTELVLDLPPLAKGPGPFILVGATKDLLILRRAKDRNQDGGVELARAEHLRRSLRALEQAAP